MIDISTSEGYRDYSLILTLLDTTLRVSELASVKMDALWLDEGLLKVVGSGGIEKNIDLLLCRRFKGRGMSWSRAGAQNLLKLRLLRYDRKDWKSYW